VREQSRTIFPNPKAIPIRNAGRTERTSFKDSDFSSWTSGNSRLSGMDEAYPQRAKNARELAFVGRFYE
jgi:hypothetical protein